jgi:zinc protease
MRTLAENRDIGFDLLRKAMTRPRFEAEAVDRMRRQAIAGLRRASKDPETIASEAFSRAVFPDHPYGRVANGTEATLTTITPADLKAHHQRLFAREGLTIAVVGAIDAKTLAGLLDQTFGALPAKADLKPVAAVVARAGVTSQISMPISQTVIRFGLPGITRQDADFIPAFVMNHILGGGSFSSWLFDEVREKRGLSYSVFSALSPLEHSGLFIGGAATRSDRAQESLDVIRAQIRRMATEGPSAEELAKAKAFLIGSYALRFDTSDKIAGQLLAIQMDALGIDYIERRNGLVEAVTLADIKRVAGRLLNGELSVVTVGPSGS